MSADDATTSDPAYESWKPGDVVLDAQGRLRVRSNHPHWVWGYPDEGEAGYVPEGSLPEDSPDISRPLTLLVRDRRTPTPRAS